MADSSNLPKFTFANGDTVMRRLVFVPLLRWAFVGAICMGIMFPVPAAYALGGSDQLATAAKDFCKLSAKAKGYNVEEVISVNPKLGDGVNVALRLSKAGKKYNYNCAYSESITEIEPVVANNDRLAQERQRTEQARLATEREQAEKAKALAERNRGAAQDRTRRTVQEDTVVRTDQDRTVNNGGIPPLVWVLPLLALPLLFLRNGTQPILAEQEKPPVKAGTYGTTTAKAVTTVANTIEAIIKNNGVTVSIYSDPSITSQTKGTLADGEKVLLSGRYKKDWAELTKGGWIDIKFLTNDPRKKV